MIKLYKHSLNATKIICYALFCLLILFQNCKFKDDSNAKAKQIEQVNPVKVRFLGHWINEGKREQLVRDVAKEFEFTHQEIKIELKFPEEIYYHREDPLSNQKFVASIIKEENPEWDIIRVNNEYQTIDDVTKDPNWTDALVDFSEIEEFRKNTLPGLLTDSVKNLWHGIIPGPFVEGVNWALWCNNAVAKKLGITVKQFDMNFEDFMGYIKAVNDYNKSHTTDYIIPVFESIDWQTTLALGFQLYASALDNPSEFFADAITENKLIAWHTTLKAIEELSKHKPLSDKWRTMHWEADKNLILEDKCLFFSNGSWMYNIWLNAKPEKMRDIMPTEYPTFKPTYVYNGGYQIIWAVLKKSPHKEEAIKFLLAWNKASVADKWARYTKCPTGIKGSFADNSFGTDQFEAYTNHIAKKYGTRKYAYNSNSEHIYGVSKRNLPNYFVEVLTGELTADDAMKRIRVALRANK
jgi:hypothetical protein